LKETIKIIIVGISIYISSRFTKYFIKKWFSDTSNYTIEDILINSSKLKKRLYKNFLLMAIIVFCCVVILSIIGSFTFCIQNIFRASAIIILLTGSLSKAPWRELTHDDKFFINRVDHYMYIISQVSGTILLIFALWL